MKRRNETLLKQRTKNQKYFTQRYDALVEKMNGQNKTPNEATDRIAALQKDYDALKAELKRKMNDQNNALNEADNRFMTLKKSYDYVISRCDELKRDNDELRGKMNDKNAILGEFAKRFNDE